MKKHNYAGTLSPRETPQSQPIPGKNMVQNSAGGFAFSLDKWGRLDRFLILGSDSPTYYASAKKLTLENAKVVADCLKEDPKRTVDRIVEISVSGRAPKNDPALFALAMAASPDLSTETAYALDSLQAVARIGTHLFTFADQVNQLRGWGRGLRNAVGDWYTTRPLNQLSYQVVKYQQRNGWSHRDLLRLGHPTPQTQDQNLVFKWITSGEIPDEDPGTPFSDTHIVGYELAKMVSDTASSGYRASVIQDYGLTREMVPTEWLKDPEVWEALLEKMPMTAMIRNLANMTRIGLLRPMSSWAYEVASRLESEGVHKAKVHPLQVLVALMTYKAGQGVARRRAVGFHSRGYVDAGSVNTWDPVPQIVDALDAAFYHSFGNVKTTDKRIMLAIDTSGSMEWDNIAGMPITPRAGSAAMAMVTARTERRYVVTAFSSGYMKRAYRGSYHGIREVDISPRRRLDDVMNAIVGGGGTDCSLPMVYALDKGLDVDAFIVYTDNETWAGRTHPVQALNEYRTKTGIPAKLIVVGMTSTGFTIADPTDPGMMDVVGFDTAAPNIMSDFVRG